MKAIFTTEKVKYELSDKGYSRNGHFTQGEVTLKDLSVGQPAVIEFKLNDYVQVIRTAEVIDIEVCPIYFKQKMDTEIHPYNISVIRENGGITKLMKIGAEPEIRKWLSDKFPNEQISYRIAPVPVKRKGVS
jgi:hypothetical protein